MGYKTMFLALGGLMIASYAKVAVGVSQLDVSHNALHRVERLIDLGKIDEGYSTAFENLKLEVLSTGDAAYRATLSQVANTSGSARKIELLMDANAKPVADDFKVIEGDEPANAPGWPDKSASDVAASALHHIEHVGKPEYQPFVDAMSAFTLSQTGSGNSLRGVLTISAPGTTDKLIVTVTGSGDMDGDPVVKKEQDGDVQP